ncbi:class I SAM-dependent methyltransferase, partial [Bacteroidota bacterium]
YMRDDGVEVVISEKCHYDSAGQVNRVEWLHKIGENEYLEKLDMRCFYPLEMDALLQYNSFNVIHKFGSFGETPFNSESQKLIYVCEIL